MSRYLQRCRGLIGRPGASGRVSRSRIVLAVVIVLSLVAAFPALGAAPAAGVVVEGRSVPGLALGDTRAQVEASWGGLSHCYDVEVGGDLAHCTYPIESGGSASVEFRGADGRFARNAPDDVVYEVSWGNSMFYTGALWDPLIDWTTTAGVNTELALSDMLAVAAAYPNAELTSDGGGNIVRVEDKQLGIRVTWGYDSYTHTTGARIYVFNPRPPAPPPGTGMRVSSLELTADKHKGDRHLLAVLRVLDDRGLPVEGARVAISWTDPRGTTSTNTSPYNLTSETGYEFFEINDARQGTWTFTVNDVLLDAYLFKPETSVLTANIRIK